MMQADDLLRVNDLAGARATLVDLVRRAPDDQRARMFLFELFCICGEWDKALNQLRAVAQLSPEAALLATVYGQVIAAERVRADAYAGRTPFSVLVPSSDWIQLLAHGLTALAAGRRLEGEGLRDQAFDSALDTPGRLGDRAFGWVADADPRLGPSFEAVVSGRWGLVPFEAVTAINTPGPESLRDLVWLPVEIALRSGQSAAAFIPARYPGTEAEPSGEVRLGRVTEWREDLAGERPVGQRVWTFDEGEDVSFLDLRRLEMG